MLKVLKTKNYLLSYQKDQSAKKQEKINQKIYRNFNKECLWINDENKPPKDNKIKHRRNLDR